MTVLQPAGLSHSEIYGSLCMCHYPELIAAYHVLHRLSKPRHPPYALCNFFLTAALVFGYYFYIIALLYYSYNCCFLVISFIFLYVNELFCFFFYFFFCCISDSY